MPGHSDLQKSPRVREIAYAVGEARREEDS